MKMKLLSIATLVFSSQLFAADILKTDTLFTNKQYKLAEQGYLEAAELGNPYAYYQLATMHLKGLSGKKDVLNALIYYTLAAEYKFRNSETIVKKIFANLPEETQISLKEILTTYKDTKGKEIINAKLFPVIANNHLTEKVTFDGKATLERVYYAEDFEDYNDDYSENSFDEDDEDSISLIISKPKLPFLLVDIEVAADGSIRNITEVQRIGYAKTLLDEFSLFPIDIPYFKSQPVDFVHRVQLGAAGYSKFTLLEENEPLYNQIRKLGKELKSDTTLAGQYNYAMALLNFRSLSSEGGEEKADEMLLSAAKQGHPGAMYEYGLKRYREQTDIPTAIHWISEASKYGLKRAEYRLGKILLSSPWVKSDEKKALFWFETAREKGHIPATMEAIKLKLIADDKTLRNLPEAINLLESIKDSQIKNPEYYYLVALSHKDRENRDFTQVVDNLQKAIRLGMTVNWDVSEWQALLMRFTRGSVYIQD